MREIAIYTNPPKSQWPALTARCRRHEQDIEATVREIIESVRTGGDAALCDIISRIDGFVPKSLEIDGETRRQIAAEVPEPVQLAMQKAKHNIEAFHKAQMPGDVCVETSPGVTCVQRAVAIDKVGLYIPGGKAPLFSTVLMLAVPAKLAGCREVVLCTPCDRIGRIAPEIIYAANLCGVDRVFAVGGAQAIAAMAYGTPSIPRVNKIFGPGNRYVTMAKQLVGARQVAIDMPAGPSEVMILADDTARPEYVAADFLSQAEHGDDSQAMLVCTSQHFARQVVEQIERQTEQLPRREIVERALDNSRIIVFDNDDTGPIVDFANAYAPEHLIISMQQPWIVAGKIRAAGSVFIGNFSPESAGDYASGTNHTLPTGGWAAAYSGVNIDSFMHKITFQQLTAAGLEALSDTIVAMARAEGLDAHARAVEVRLKGGDA